jgi:thiosulfate reductase/polysulfide reductase chain A
MANDLTAEVVARRGTCPVCGLGCFVEAKIVGDVPVSIRPDHRSGHPADCPRAGQARDYHDHRERLNHPLKRLGARGEGKWARIGWDEALDEIAAKLAEIRDRHGPEAVQLLGGSLKGPGDAAAWRFANLFGTPNILHQGKNCGEAEVLAEWATYGELTAIGGAPAVPGLTRCVILWGSNPAVGKGIRAKRLYAELRKAGGKLIVVDPCRTEMTEMADVWLQLRPGTDGALAYAMLNVIIREKLYDAQFVDKWCLGFEALAAMVAPWTPERAAQITWIPAEKIVEAARIYAKGPSLIPFGLGAAELGKATTSAVFGKTYLRAITGNLDREGGSRFADLPESAALRADMQWDYLLEHPLRTRDNVSADIWPAASVRAMKAFRAAMAKVHPQGVGPAQYMMFAAPSSVWTAILEAKPYPLKALICQGGNAMVALGDARRIHQALSSDNLELSVNMDHWITPGGQLADYLLPATDGLERPLLGNMWGFGDTYEAAHRLVAPRMSGATTTSSGASWGTGSARRITGPMRWRGGSIGSWRRRA